MMRAAWIETLAAAFGMAGALAVAIPGLQGWGFAVFLVSNLGWLAFSAGHRYWKLFAQQLVFMASSMLGLWNWWLAPLLKG
jgi:hypothetical protein